MTSRWGPLGWATLHSVSLLYPENPSSLEIQLLRRWIASFNDTIVCPSCMEHFRETRTRYEREHPGVYSSRKEFCLFILRAHNSVNRRTAKHEYTLDETVAELHRILPPERASAKRVEYLQYIRRQWSLDRGLSGVSALGKLRELQMTEQQYWSVRGAPDWTSMLELLQGESVEPLVEKPADSSSPIRTLTNAIAMPTFSLFKHTKGRLSLLHR